MKSYRFLFLTAMALMATSASAQFRTALGIGMAAQSGRGFLGYIEPSYKIRNVALGIKGEVLYRIPSSRNEITTSWSVFGQHYFISGPFRLFGGVGLGVYFPGKIPSYCDCTDELTKNLLGFYPKFGMEYKHLVVTADYNFIGRVTETSQSIIPNQQPNPVYTKQYSINYLSLKVGLLLGGGK